jgi:prepilin-type N-terminal cleavage/methylation domain-containing protein
MTLRRQQAGFTLYELLVVITIMIIIAAMAVPTLMRTIRNYQMEAAARQVSNMIVTARYEAMRRNRRVCTLYEQSGPETRFGLDVNGPDKDPCDDATPTLDAGDRFTVTDRTIMWFRNGIPAISSLSGLPTAYDDPSEATAPTPRYRITFSPRGTVVVNAGGAWNLATTVQMIELWRMAAGTDVDRILITVTPVGRVKLYRWDYPGSRWLEM